MGSAAKQHQNRIKRFVALLLIVLVVSKQAVLSAALYAGPALYAQAAVLMDADTGQILYSKSGNARMQPASLTKLMTCLLALEYGGFGEPVTVTADALRLMRGASTIGLREGEQLTMGELLYATMLPSANDAANAVGVHIAGSVEAFVERMNNKLDELGLTDSRFSNPNGLPSREHYASAYDLAMITREALSYDRFIDYAGASGYTIPATVHSQPRSLAHTNRMLRPNDDWYHQDAIAGKTGWTYPAGNCLMTVFRRDGRTLIGVVLKSDSEDVTRAVYRDMEALYQYGFTGVEQYTLSLEGETREMTLDRENGMKYDITLTREAADMTLWLPAGIETLAAVRPDPEDIELKGGIQQIASLVYIETDGVQLEWPVAAEEVTLSIQEIPPPAEPAAQETIAEPEIPNAPFPYSLYALAGSLTAGSAALACWLYRRSRKERTT